MRAPSPCLEQELASIWPKKRFSTPPWCPRCVSSIATCRDTIDCRPPILQPLILTMLSPPGGKVHSHFTCIHPSYLIFYAAMQPHAVYDSRHCNRYTKHSMRRYQCQRAIYTRCISRSSCPYFCPLSSCFGTSTLRGRRGKPNVRSNHEFSSR